MQKYQLGEKIKITSKLVRKASYRRSEESSINTRIKEWEEFPIAETEVVVVGIRTLWDGSTFYEEGNIFVPEKHFRALSVVENLNNKPFYTSIK